MSEQTDVTADEALQVAQRALAKVVEQERTIEELEETCDALKADLAAVQERLDEVDGDE